MRRRKEVEARARRDPRDFHRIVYVSNADAARAASAAFDRAWARRCPGVVATLRDGRDELLTFCAFPKA